MKTDNMVIEGASVITVTSNDNMIDNIFNNYTSQDYINKELILIINNTHISKEKYLEYFENIPNVLIYSLNKQMSLGACLNLAVEKSNYDIIALFNDDDYYGYKYLTNSIKTMKDVDALVIGKATNYVYFEDTKILAIRNMNRENSFLNRVEGATLIFDKCVFNIINFVDKSLGVGIRFCKDCIKNKIPIYSSDKYDYVYMRHSTKREHPWEIDNNLYVQLCEVIGNFDDFREFIKF